MSWMLFLIGLQLAGFQVTITGRFWVSTEVQTVGHSLTGIMRAGWSAEELKLIWGGKLHFTARQGETMREGVMRRIQDSHRR